MINFPYLIIWDLEMVLFEKKSMFHLQDEQSFPIAKSCHSQIADKLEIPVKYYHKMETESPELLVENVNTWLKKSEKDFFIRGLGESESACRIKKFRSSVWN